MSDRVDVTSSPSASGTVLFQLHEGTRACILDRTSGWTEVELDNGNVDGFLNLRQRTSKRPSPQRPLTTAGHFSFTPLVQMESP